MSEEPARKVTPDHAYRQLIDELVERVPSGAERLLREEGAYGRGGDDAGINRIVRGLTPEGRFVLAETCRRERIGGIHDALAVISWWIDCRGLRLSIDEEELRVDESGMGLHGDFIGRLNDWSWPGEIS